MQVNAAQSLKAQDLRLFTDIVNCGDGEAGDTFPLGERHWINQAVEGEQGRTLLLAALTDHLHHFTEVLLRAGARADLYSEELGVAPLHVAVQAGELAGVKVLLEGRDRGGNTARINQGSKVGRTALHMAAEQREVDIIHYLLNRKDIDVDPKDNKGGQTPLYLAVKNKHPQIVEMLIENGASVDSVVLGKPVSVHILEKMPGFDLASIKVLRAPLVRQTSASVLESMMQLVDGAGRGGGREQEVLQEFRDLALQVDTKELNTARSSGLTLLQRCAVADLAVLAEVLLAEGGVDPNFCPEAGAAPVHLAAYRGHAAVLRVLAKYRADFTLVTANKETVLHKLLVKDDAFKPENFDKCLDFILSVEDDRLRAQVDQMINRKDLLGNTALHYATQRWGEDTVRRLLERGANIGIKNRWGEVPINNIHPSTMEAFLDEFCLQSSLQDVNHEDFELTFNYSFLAPPVEALPADVQGPHYEDTDETEKISEKFGEKRFALPETESLWYMGQSKEHRHLLRHPVITSFLWCKWTRIRRFVNRNLRFYFFFVMILTWFIFEEYGGISLKTTGDQPYIPALYVTFVIFSVGMLAFVLMDWMSDMKDMLRQEQLRQEYGLPPGPSSGQSCLRLVLSNWLEAALLASLGLVIYLGRPALSSALAILLAGLVAREVFQVAVSLRRYLLTLENWLEAVLLLLVTVLLAADVSLDLKKHLAAIALLLSWAELVTFVAKHPRLTRYNVYVTMFYKVLTSFFFFLLWYVFFIIAFGMGFYIMLHKDVTPANVTAAASDGCRAGEDEEEGLQQFFNSPFLSFVKTCTMFVGELEFSDIPIDRDDPLMHLSYTFFLAFVFLIVVVLMNLLNGLAVSDTGLIQEQAEAVAYLSQVETISYAESLLLGDPFDFLASVPAVAWLSSLPSLSCCRQLYRSRTARRIFQRITGAHSILLFYNYLHDRRLVIKPNARNQDCVRVVKVGQQIVDAAKTIVLAREKAAKWGREGRGLEGEVARLGVVNMEVARRLEEAREESRGMVDKMARLEMKMDLLIQKL